VSRHHHHQVIPQPAARPNATQAAVPTAPPAASSSGSFLETDAKGRLVPSMFGPRRRLLAFITGALDAIGGDGAGGILGGALGGGGGGATGFLGGILHTATNAIGNVVGGVVNTAANKLSTVYAQAKQVGEKVAKSPITKGVDQASTVLNTAVGSGAAAPKGSGVAPKGSGAAQKKKKKKKKANVKPPYNVKGSAGGKFRSMRFRAQAEAQVEVETEVTGNTPVARVMRELVVKCLEL